MSNKIKLIATDLDGTLIRGYRPDCSEKAVELMTKLAEKGVYIVPASGRQYFNLQNMFKDVQGDLMYICENGALVMYKDKVVLKNSFDRELAMGICHLILDNPYCEALISGERTCYVVTENHEYVDYLRNHIKNDVTEVDSPEDIAEDIIKISYFVPEEKCQEVTEEFAKFAEGRCILAVSGNEWVDFAPFNTSKGDALAAIEARMGISKEDMVAFGDNENDRTMLEFVGHPYLMADGNPTMMDLDVPRCNSVEEELERILSNLSC